MKNIKSMKSIKKVLAKTLVLTTALTSIFATNIFASNLQNVQSQKVFPMKSMEDISVILNYGEKTATLLAAQYEDDIIFFPIREFCEKLGAELLWDSKTSTATVTAYGLEVKFTVNSNSVIANGQLIENLVETIIIDGTMHVGSPFLTMFETPEFSIDENGNKVATFNIDAWTAQN